MRENENDFPIPLNYHYYKENSGVWGSEGSTPNVYYKFYLGLYLYRAEILWLTWLFQDELETRFSKVYYDTIRLQHTHLKKSPINKSLNIH